jgi:peptide/nickel transport system substrate-binding protein
VGRATGSQGVDVVDRGRRLAAPVAAVTVTLEDLLSERPIMDPTMRRVSTLAVGVAVAALVLAASGSPRAVKEGGTFRVAVPAGIFDSIDPALAFTPASNGRLLRPACGTLMAFPDLPGQAGLRLQPELAEAPPTISKDGRTYTFTIRKDARFSNGAPVTAQAFVHAVERILDPAMKSPYATVVNVFQRQVARGRTLTWRLTKPIPDLPAAFTTALCAVPPNLPADPEGSKAPLPSAGPYYVSDYSPGERLVLERNRFYKGKRPQHVERIVADLGADAGAAVDDVERGKLDWAYLPNADRVAELAKRYGVNKSRFFVVPGLGLRMVILNDSRPLFRKNVKLRQALNFAIDRRAFVRQVGSLIATATDQYLSPLMPGYRDARIYPLTDPDLAEARALIKGRPKGEKAVLYIRDDAPGIAQAQILTQNLKAIGIEVETKQFPGRLLFQKLATPGEPFDLSLVSWTNLDPFERMFLFDGRRIDQPNNTDLSYFNSATYNRAFDRADGLSGAARDRAYGDLDIRLSRDFAPAIPVANGNAFDLVSARVAASCVVMNPNLDLTAVCLK